MRHRRPQRAERPAPHETRQDHRHSGRDGRRATGYGLTGRQPPPRRGGAREPLPPGPLSPATKHPFRESPCPPPSPAPRPNQRPLGLAAFGTATFMLSFFYVGVDPALTPVVFPLAFFFGGGIQVIAGAAEFSPTLPDPGARLERLGHRRARPVSLTSSIGEREPRTEHAA
ncbi:GPR1/FUN34/YaaH family transporter [Nonomuraea jabiensis]|uniref:GPR1/FUN34/YaaH family transporter n=1 Tax=Nonomuraea jabiensis TaxID=882448 RepID=UPI0036827B06